MSRPVYSAKPSGVEFGRNGVERFSSYTASSLEIIARPICERERKSSFRRVCKDSKPSYIPSPAYGAAKRDFLKKPKSRIYANNTER